MSETFTIVDSGDNTLYSATGDSLGEVVAAAVAAGTDLSDAQLIGADLSGIDLTGAVMVGANLQGARIVGTNLTNANLRVANLTGADLSYATVNGAALSSASLATALLNGVNMNLANVAYGVTGGKAFAQTTVPAGDTIANALTGTFATTYDIPAGALAVGDVVRITARGGWSATGTNPTLTLAFLLGASALGAVATGALSVKPSDNGWSLQADLVCRSVGAAATFESHGVAVMGLATGAPLVQNLYNSDPDANEVDMTGPCPVSLFVTWSAAAAGNTITLRQLIVEILKA